MGSTSRRCIPYRESSPVYSVENTVCKHCMLKTLFVDITLSMKLKNLPDENTQHSNL